MTAKDAIKLQELAAYELAEAESDERAASRKRMNAVRLLAQASAFFNDALKVAEDAKKNSHQTKPKQNK